MQSGWKIRLKKKDTLIRFESKLFGRKIKESNQNIPLHKISFKVLNVLCTPLTNLGFILFFSK